MVSMGVKKEKRIIRSKEKEITITMKEQTKGTVGNLLDLFTDQMVRFKIHSFNIGNQLKHYRLTKENLQENEALLHIDFAENFQTKLSREIAIWCLTQSNYNSEGVYYNGNNSACSFATVSDSMDHSLPAIWAYLEPVLDRMQRENPHLNALHIFSDGPTT